MIFCAQMHRLLDEDDKSVELPTGYELDAAGTNLLLKRRDLVGSLLRRSGRA
jgi:hypothetical protein